MTFSPKPVTPTSGSGASKGAAPGVMPYKGHLWRNDKPLVVELHKAEYLAEWGLTQETFLECANRWSAGVIVGGNFIPKFEFKDSSPPDIIVELNSKNSHCLHNNYHYYLF